MSTSFLSLPEEFNQSLTIQFLQRSPKEMLHDVKDNSVTKLMRVGEERLLLKITVETRQLRIEYLNATPSEQEKNFIAGYITEWFGLDADLKPFYKFAQNDKLLGPPVKAYYGYRIVGQPDLFESLVWAVLGQQINVQFAYTLKQRFVEGFGEKLIWKEKPYFLFPQPTDVAVLTDNDLLPLQFSRQKSRYTVAIAESFASGELSKEKLRGLPLDEAKKELVKIKGVGNWTANYALMKTFRYPDAFPLEDAGIHNAIKNLKKLREKPTLDQVRKIFKKYKGWEAYATLYLWKSL